MSGADGSADREKAISILAHKLGGAVYTILFNSLQFFMVLDEIHELIANTDATPIL